MSLNLEKTVKDWIDTDPNGDGLTAYLEVPADRPKRFVTIERVGGSENEYSSHPCLLYTSAKLTIAKTDGKEAEANEQQTGQPAAEQPHSTAAPSIPNPS